MEDYVHILDFLPQGRPDSAPARREPTLMGLGEQQFTLFELVPKPGASFTIGDRAYVGKDVEQRGKVAHPMKVIVGRIMHELQDPTEKYHIFVRPPAQERDEWRGPRRS